ncbi:hypothetical protein [Streptomyces sp. NPDC059597]|uniref:hypothetical protein n=1 Tax=Streptomyces sp. NPDC059597 TaxID=3346879 RepID=UPI0036C2EB8F
MSGPAPLPPATVLVLDRDDWLYVYTSFAHVTNDLEAIDVAEGEYTAYAPDGRVLALTAPGGRRGPVVLARTEEFDPVGLERRVARSWRRHHPRHPPLGPAETARRFLDEESRPREGWGARLPKRG